MFRKIRIKYASKFGKIEHKSGRLLGLVIFIGTILTLFYPHKYPITHRDVILSAFWVLAFICWITYLTAHTFEKKIYGKHGFR